MQERSRTEYSMLNILTGLGGYVLNTILGFLCRMVFVRYLAEDYLGVNGLFTNVIAMLSLAELGVGGAIVYALYKPLAEHDEGKIASLVQFYGKAYRIIGIVVAGIGTLLIPFLDFIIQSPPNIQESIYLLYVINLFNTASTYFFSYRSSLIIAAQQNYIVTGLNYLVTIVQSILQMIALRVTHNYLFYLLIQTAGTFLYNVMVSKIAVVKFPYIKNKNIEPLSKSERKKIFENIRDLMFYKVSGLLVNSTDNILITYFKGLSAAGITSNYTLLTTTLTSLLGQVFNGLTASIGNHNVTQSNEKRYEMFSFINMMNFWIFGWASLGIVFCSSDLVQLCFGEKYVLSNEIPIILAVNFYTVGMMNAIWTYKHTMGLFYYGRLLQIVTGILNIIFSIALGNIWGVFGILLATFFARLCTNLWYDPYAVFVHGFGKSPLKYLIKYVYYLVVLGIAALMCKFAFEFIQGTLIVKVILEIIVCSIVTNFVFLIVFYRTKEFEKLKAIICNVIGIIRK